MTSDRQIMEEAKYLISNNATQKEVAEHFNISIRTLQLHLKKLKDINLEIYNAVIAVRDKNEVLGKIRGGSLGIKKTKYSSEDLRYIAIYILSHNLTLKEAEAIFGIPKSTLFENLTNNLNDKEILCDLESLFDANKRFNLSPKMQKKYEGLLDSNYVFSFDESTKKR